MATSNIDTTGYVDLTIFDRTAQEIYDDALAYVQWIMPQWEPAETNIENVVMQAVALMIAEGEYTINRLTNATVEVLLKLHGVTRQSGEYPVVTVTFTALDAAGYTIPAGTEVLHDLGDGGDPIVFTLDEDAVIAPGATTTTGVMTGSLVESRFNSIPAGTSFSIVTPLSFLFSVVTTTLVTGGVDPEDDTAYFNRGALRLARLTETLVLPRHFESYALESNTAIKRAKTLDLYDPATGPTPGSNAGHVTIAVFGDGIPVTTGDKATLLTAIESAAVSSLTFHISDPENINLVGVHLSVVLLPSADSAVTNQSIIDSLAYYLSPLIWPWSSVIRYTNIVAWIESNPGVDYISTLSITLNRIAWDQSTFYTGISNWANTTNCTLAFDADVAHGEIGGSMKITATAAADAKATSTAAIATNSYVATATKVYWVSGWFFIAAGQTARTVRMGVAWYTSGNVIIGTQIDTVGVLLAPGEWVNIGEAFTAPATTAKALIYIEIDAAGAGQVFYVDDITLAEYQTAYSDVTLVGNGPLTMASEIVVTNV